MSDQDTIGVVRAHRWASIEEQRSRLKADGCRTIIDLASADREYLLRSARDGAGTCVKVLYAFLLADARKQGAVRMLSDYRVFTEKLAKLPRRCHGYVKDVDSGFVADTPGKRKAMLAVVREQIARHRKGLKSAENGKRGGQTKDFTEIELAKGEAAWMNVQRYPTWDDVAPVLAKINKELTVWYAHAKWGPRKFGVNRTRG